MFRQMRRHETGIVSGEMCAHRYRPKRRLGAITMPKRGLQVRSPRKKAPSPCLAAVDHVSLPSTMSRCRRDPKTTTHPMLQTRRDMSRCSRRPATAMPQIITSPANSA